MALILPPLPLAVAVGLVDIWKHDQPSFAGRKRCITEPVVPMHKHKDQVVLLLGQGGSSAVEEQEEYQTIRVLEEWLYRRTMGQNTAGYHAFAGVSFSGFYRWRQEAKRRFCRWRFNHTEVAAEGLPGGGGRWTHPGGADWGHGGGGGGSFNSGTDQNNTSGVNIGHGKYYHISRSLTKLL